MTQNKLIRGKHFIVYLLGLLLFYKQTFPLLCKVCNSIFFFKLTFRTDRDAILKKRIITFCYEKLKLLPDEHSHMDVFFPSVFFM